MFSSILLAGCGASHVYSSPVPVRSAAADQDIRRLVLDAAASGETCNKVRDRFVGLPVEGGPTGAVAGTTPIGGRWWIRDCLVVNDGNWLRLRLAGPAWYRVAREASGFSIDQYVYFNAEAEMSGALDVGYDPAARLASLWFTPVADAQVRIEPLGSLNLRPETVGAFLLQVFTLNTVPSAAARAEVVSQGEEAFRGRLSSGLTITVDLNRQGQVDVLVGQLARGQAPVRPFADAGSWIVNEREELFPGGIQITGPFPPQTAVVDAIIERGTGADFAFVCARDVQVAFNSLSTGVPPALPAAAVFARQHVTYGSRQSWSVSAPCPWYLLATTRDASVAVAVWARGEQALPGTSQSAIVRVTLLSLEIVPRKPDGSAWDALEGDPDPEITLLHGTVTYRLVPKMKDTLRAAPIVAAPEPLEITRGTPIEVRVIDRDVAVDDEIGSAIVRLEDLSGGPDLTRPIRLQNATTGSVRLRVEVMAWR